MRSAWQQDLFKFSLHRTVSVAHGSAAKRKEIIRAGAEFVIINFDGVQIVKDEIINGGFDLIVVDEAHKMSAHYFGSKLEETGRFKLGKLLGGITRHYLLMTATPHNGKEEDFQLFMALLDGDRFEGRFRDGVHT